jgi:hypothetical protein
MIQDDKVFCYHRGLIFIIRMAEKKNGSIPKVCCSIQNHEQTKHIAE